MELAAIVSKHLLTNSSRAERATVPQFASGAPGSG
jgi:hypothetical protein